MNRKRSLQLGGDHFVHEARAPPKLEDKEALRQAEALMRKARLVREPVKRIKLANEALAISLDCVEAYTVLTRDKEKIRKNRIAMYERAVEAGRRALGEVRFKRDAGIFWDFPETRPFMRALLELAQELAAYSRSDEAVDHYKELLRLDPVDHVCARNGFISLLLSLGRLDEAEKLLPGGDFEGAEMAYNRVLLLFKKHGDTEETRLALAHAVVSNPNVLVIMLDQARTYMKTPQMYLLGSKEDAYYYVQSHCHLWFRTKGAIRWLVENLVDNYLHVAKAKRS